MAVDRRSTLRLIGVALLHGCAQARPARAAAGDFRRRFVDPGGRVIDSGNGGISHSEGQGYAMLLAEAAGDRAGFDLIWGWTRRTLMRPDGLFAWRYDPKAEPPVADPNNATDGDLLIAWALLRAARRWPGGGHDDASHAIRRAIAGALMREQGGRLILLPGLTGFTAGGRVTLNPSYYVWPALDAFAAIDGGPWRRLAGDGERLLRQARFGAAGLPSDWIDLADDGAVTPAAGRPPRFGYDAVRVPLYLAWSGRRAALRPFAAVWGGYAGRRAAVPAWIDVTDGTTADYPLSAGGMAIVRLVLGGRTPVEPPAPAGAEDYYSAALGALAGLAAR